MAAKMSQGQRLVRARDYAMRRRVLALWRERTHYIRLITHLAERALTRIGNGALTDWKAATREAHEARADSARANALLSVQEELVVVRAELDVFRRRLSDRDAEIAQQNSDISIVRADRDALLAETAEMRGDVDANRRAALSARREAAESADLLQEAREAAKERLLRIDALTTANAALVAEVAALRGRAERAEARAEGAVRERGEAVLELGGLRETVRLAQDERDVLRRELGGAKGGEREAREAVAALLGDYARVESEYREKALLLESTSTRLTRRDKECVDLRARLRVLEKACRDTQKALDESYQGEEAPSEMVPSLLNSGGQYRSIMSHTSSPSPPRTRGDFDMHGSCVPSPPSDILNDSAEGGGLREDKVLAEVAARHRELSSRFGVPLVPPAQFVASSGTPSKEAAGDGGRRTEGLDGKKLVTL